MTNKNEVIITSVVRRIKTQREVSMIDIGKSIRNIILFENKTDNEVDIYIELKDKRFNHYFHAANIKGNLSAVSEEDLQLAMRQTVRYEADDIFNKSTHMRNLLCEKYFID